MGMNLTRTCPTEWNEFMTVALGIPEDEPLQFLTPAGEEEDTNNTNENTNAQPPETPVL